MTIQRVLHIVGKMDRAGAETMLMNLYRHIDHSQIQFDFITGVFAIDASANVSAQDVWRMWQDRPSGEVLQSCERKWKDYRGAR